MDKLILCLPWAYIVAVSTIAIFVTAYDKWASKHRPECRIRERTLFLWAAVGGSFAMFLTMQAIRHKTKHLSFMLGIPAIMVVQTALIFAIDYLF